MIRAVLDTNVLVAALINPQGISGTLLARLRGGEFTAIASPELMDEVIGILSDPEFRTKHKIERADFESIAALFIFKTDTVAATKSIRLCRDPNDDFLLEAAVAGKADYLVSGDKDLLVLKKVQKTRIMKPAAFLSRLDKNRR